MKTITVKLSDIIFDNWMTAAMNEVKDGKLSYTEGNPEIWMRRNGTIEISDGRHRICEAILNGNVEMEMDLLPIIFEDMKL